MRANGDGYGITSDNLLLSEPIQASPGSFAINTDPHPEADAKVLEFIKAARSANTRRAYQSDLRHFLAWGGSIPARPRILARYLADHAGAFAMATLARRLAGIGRTHALEGFPNPAASTLVQMTLRGIRRTHGRPQRQVEALRIADLRAIMFSLGSSPREIRDRALLLVGFAGGFRRSELSGIDLRFLERTSQGFIVTLSRSKTDQEGQGRKVIIPTANEPLCPVKALDRWLSVSGITDGPVFRPVTKTGRVLPRKISAEAIAVVVKQRVGEIGRDLSRYSGHSLRAGFATAAAAAGIPQWRIKLQTGHASGGALERYIRDGELFANLSVALK